MEITTQVYGAWVFHGAVCSFKTTVGNILNVKFTYLFSGWNYFHILAKVYFGNIRAQYGLPKYKKFRFFEEKRFWNLPSDQFFFFREKKKKRRYWRLWNISYSYWGEVWGVISLPSPPSVPSPPLDLFSFFHFMRLFWNHILICRSVRQSACAISILLRLVRYRLKWNSFSNSNVWYLV